MLKHRELWAKAHGPIPKGYVVHFLNGNTQDYSLYNLAAVPRHPRHLGQITAPYRERIKSLERKLSSIEDKK
jgi:hypothetical protein